MTDYSDVDHEAVDFEGEAYKVDVVGAGVYYLVIAPDQTEALVALKDLDSDWIENDDSVSITWLDLEALLKLKFYNDETDAGVPLLWEFNRVGFEMKESGEDARIVACSEW